MPNSARIPAGGRERVMTSPSKVEQLETRKLLADVPEGFTDAQVASSLFSPTAMAVAPDGRIFFTTQNGQVRVIKDGQHLTDPFSTVNANAEAERGLLGITFDPDFASNHFVYVYYTSNEPALHNRVSRFTAAGDVATGGETVILDLPDVGGAIYHMGGALHFGPDGKLYVAVGDHQDFSAPQFLGSVRGKMLRINSDGSIPSDNPFYNQTSGINRAIWARGLRNPFTFAFQPGSGRMFINDVGQELYEEINNGTPAGNYGWPASEGPNNTGGFDAPFYWYDHSQGCSIAGAAFYNPTNEQFPPSYVGKFLFGDYCGGYIKTIDPTDASSVATFATGIEGIVDIDVASDGSLYYLARGADLNAGNVGRITFGQSGAPVITTHPQDQTASVGESVSFGVVASGNQPLSYQWQRDGADIPGATESTYTIDSVAQGDDGARFRVVVTNPVNAATSDEATLTVTANQAPVATITAPAAGTTFRAGDTINYSGTGVDPEDGDLPGSAFTWQVDYYTNNLVRPFIPATSGQTSGSFVVPTTGVYKRPDVFYRIILTVRDSGGRTHTTSRDITPITSTVTLATNVAGLTLTLDGQVVEAPHTFGSVVNFQREIGAPSPQLSGSVNYEFVGWSDGGAIVHTIHTPDDDTTYTATFRPLTQAFVSDLPFASATNGHGPVERDMSNGEQQPGDGRPITLNGVVYPRGLGTHADSEVVIDLGGSYATFVSDVGVDDEVGGSSGSVRFLVYLDGATTPAYDSGPMNGNSQTQQAAVDVSGATTLRLVVTDGGDGNAYDHADWAAARLLAPAVSVLESRFRFETAPHALTFRFDRDVSASLTIDDLIVRNTTSGAEVPRSAMSLAYDTATNTATITFPGLTGGLLPDARFRATILAAGVFADGGGTLGGDHVFDFFFLRGDANHDARVNLLDFNRLTSNFGQSERDFTQGDFDYDGVVNLRDFNLLAARFGSSV